MERNAWRWTLWLPSAAAAVAYLLTLFPGLPLWDSPELITTARQLGIHHPPGSPLYLLLLHGWMMIWPARLAWMANLFSAICMLGALATALKIFLQIRPAEDSFAARIAGPLVVGAAFLTRPVWWQAARAEVYAPAFFLALLAVYFSLRLWRRMWPERSDFFWPAFFASLTLATHLMVGACLLPAVAAAVLIKGGRNKDRGAVALGLLLPLILFAYYPLRDDAPLFAGWQIFGSSADLFRYLAGRSGSNQLWGELSFSGIQQNAQLLLQDYWKQNGLFYSLVMWGLAAIGGTHLLIRQRGAAVILLIFGGAPLAGRLLMMPDVPNPDVYGYLLGSTAGIALLAACGAELLQRLRGAAWPTLFLGMYLLTGQLAGGPLWSNWDNLRGENHFEAALRALPPRSVVYLSSFHSTFLSWEKQALEERRPDVTFVYLGMIDESWYPARLGAKDLQARRLIAAFPGQLELLARQRPVFLEPGLGLNRLSLPPPPFCPNPFYTWIALPPCPPASPGAGIASWPTAEELLTTDRVTRDHFIFQLHQLLAFFTRAGLPEGQFFPYRQRLNEYLPLSGRR